MRKPPRKQPTTPREAWESMGSNQRKHFDEAFAPAFRELECLLGRRPTDGELREFLGSKRGKEMLEGADKAKRRDRADAYIASRVAKGDDPEFCRKEMECAEAVIAAHPGASEAEFWQEFEQEWERREKNSLDELLKSLDDFAETAPELREFVEQCKRCAQSNDPTLIPTLIEREGKLFWVRSEPST